MRIQGWMGLPALLAVVALAGCGRGGDGRAATSAGAVAVIDLDEIARRLGSDKQIVEAVFPERENALSQQLVGLAKSYSAQIAEQKAKLPADQQAQSGVTLASWEQQANASLNQVKQRAALDLQNHRVQMVQKFRDQIKPTARRVAQRGLSVIVTKNDSVVFDYTSGVDITDAVVDELLASSTAAPKVATQVPAAAATSVGATAGAASAGDQR